MRRIGFALLGVWLLLLLARAPIAAPAFPSVTGRREQTTLTVFAAASLTEAFSAIGQEFAAANPDVKVAFNFAGSQRLAQQIAEGAPADVFASADNRQMETIIAAGRITSGTQRTFVRNRLVVITPDDNPAALTSLADLATPGVKIVFAAPEVPVGQYSVDFLEKADGSLGAGYKEAVLANVASYEENVRAVLAKVTLGEADAGIVYTSDITRDAGDWVLRFDIPDPLNTIATYPIAPLKDSTHGAVAQRFIDYVLAAEGQAILVQYGFIGIE
ncbi:MAG: molybdate ABC transporter substrate-binding protein [Chloroflexi bacterium]|nr:MAG: molybdate ABC transporter substrate-binding protein [Chloroflexota bacterium]